MTHLSAEQSAEISDTELVHSSQGGDRQSFCLLYQRYQQKVRSTLYQLCGTSLLEDLVQEVFLRAWQGLPKLKNPEYFATWLYRISWNVATDQRRQFAKQPPTVVHSKEKEYLFADSTPNQLIQLHYRDLVQQGLQTLSLEHRAVLILHDLRDLPQKNVAEILAIPVGTVKSRLFHARSAMRQFLEHQGVSL